MNLKSILGLTLAGASLVVSIGIFAHRQESVDAEPDSVNVPTSYIEVMPESSKEAYRTHFRDGNGNETEVHIKYQDGTTAKMRLYRNGDVDMEKRYFLDGGLHKEAYFDLRGKLISGFELRDDGTILWRTLVEEPEHVVTETYWPGGQLFCSRVYDRENDRVYYAFYRENGSIWQRLTTVGHDVVIEQSVYDDNARVRVYLSVIKEGLVTPLIQVAYLNEDGSAEFDQRFGYSADRYYDPESGEPNPNRLVIKNVGIYNADRIVQRTHLNPSGRIFLIERFGEDYSVEKLHVQYTGQITQIEKINSGGGKSSLYNFEGGFGIAPPLDKRYLAPLPDKDLPYRLFEQSEREHSKK